MSDAASRSPGLARGLSAKLLVLTIFFVMLSELFIYAPSVSRYRKVYLEDRLADAHLATLALEATPDNMVSEELRTRLLDHARAYAVASQAGDERKLMLMRDMPPEIDLAVDLRAQNFMTFMTGAFGTLVQSGNRVLRVVGPSPKDPDVLVEVVLDETPLRVQMYDYSQRILLLSLVISFFTAALVYLSLHWLLVRPMHRMTESMTSFSADPENAANMIQPGGRTDEVGVAERELHAMQQGLRAALRQKEHLAALGTAVTKINHDLRNILASASLVSDRLESSEDPEVRRVTPTIVTAINRAVNLCAQTLNFTREGPPVLDLSCFTLHELAADVGASLPKVGEGEVAWRNSLPEDLEVEADRDQLYRVLHNLAHNAVDIGASEIEIVGEANGREIAIDVADNGPGLSPRAQRHLFQPFFGSARSGGSGLGLAIARDLMRAHGGEIELARTDARGTCFRLTLPLRQETRYKDGAARNGEG